jgi:hypothetical protein
MCTNIFIPQKGNNIKRYSSTKSPSSLNPNWISGFTDAEGCFTIGIQKKTNWKVQPTFKIELHSKDIYLLKLFQKYFNNIGKINQQGNKAYIV